QPANPLFGGGANAQPQATTRADVSVASSNVTDVVLRVEDGFAIPGTVRAESGDLKDYMQPQQQNPQLGQLPANIQALIGGRRINLMMSEGVNLANPNGQYSDDGKFNITGVYPAKYFVNVSQLQQGVYVKSIKFSGRDITHSELDVTSGSS